MIRRFPLAIVCATAILFPHAGQAGHARPDLSGHWTSAADRSAEGTARERPNFGLTFVAKQQADTRTKDVPVKTVIPAKATLQQVAWFAGVWSGTDGPVTFEERWTPAASNAIFAVSRTIKEGRVVAFEFLRVVERNGGLVYVAQPNGRPPTEFILTEIAADSATFENPAHDFPKMIRYVRQADGSLQATISGAGGQAAQTFRFLRQE